MSIRLAAFIMTYERPKDVLIMIDNLFGQTLPPQKILVVDNSQSQDTADAVRALNNPRVGYYRTGYNAGPAGAAHMGLKILAEEGFEWVYWGDDDDPPRSKDAMELVLSRRDADPEIGALGAIGNYFTKAKARMLKIPNGTLKPAHEVDVIAGGSTFIVNTRVTQKGCFPDKDLFFGFEEFDFCHTMQKAGFKLIINGDLLRRYRAESNRKPSNEDVFESKVLWREYYSIRNLLYIFTHKHFNLWIILVILFRTFGKQCYSLTRGGSFFKTYVVLTTRAVADGFRKNMGLTLQPGKTHFNG